MRSARTKTAFQKGVIGLYTLWKTVGKNAPQVVGYYDGWEEGVAAVEEDLTKNDDVDVGYNLQSDEVNKHDCGDA